MFGFDSRRKIKNVTLTRDFQIRYYGPWFLISIVLISLLSIGVYLMYADFWSDLIAQNPLRSLDFVYARSRFIAKIMFLSAVLLMGLTALGIITAHRVAGPFLGLKRAFNAVKGGNWGYRIRFRKEDQLGELETSFNEMMDSIEGKKEDPKGS